MAYTKIVLAEDLLRSDLPDDPFLRSELFSYFPAKMRQGYRGPHGAAPAAPRDRGHPDRQPAGQQRRHHLLPPAGRGDQRDDRGADQGQLRGPRDLRRRQPAARRSPSFDNQLDADVQTHMRLESRTLVERASRWLLNSPPHRRGDRVGGRHLRGGRREGDGRAAHADGRGASCSPSSSAATSWSTRACRRSSPSGWRSARRRT